MFSKNMSYYKILEALKNTSQSSDLNHFAKGCLQSSFKNPFVRALFRQYPPPAPIRRMIDAALIEAPHPIDLNVHNGALSHERAKTKDYLFKKYPCDVSEQLIFDLTEFITDALANSEVMDELLIAHQQRLLETRKTPNQAQTREFTIQTILADFNNYTEHLQKNFIGESTFAWGVIACLLKRLGSLDGQALTQSKIELMRALDDSRTAYFGKQRKFLLSGQDYSCGEGLEERCLDHHAYLVPSVKMRTYEKAIMELITPFLQPIQDEHGFFSRYVASTLLIKLYTQAAGYQVLRSQNTEFQFLPNITDEALNLLKNEYISKKIGCSIDTVEELINLPAHRIVSLSQDNKALRTKIVQETLSIKTFIRIIKEGYACYPINEVPDFIDFLQKRAGAALITSRVSAHDRVEFIKPKFERTEQDIIEAMLGIGPFVDKAHLLTVLAITPLSDIKEMVEVDPSVELQTERVFSKEDALSAYKVAKIFLEQLHRNYYDFYLPEIDNQFFRKESMRAPICSEEVFLTFLSINKERLLALANIKPTLEAHAILCVKNGYRRVLAELIAVYGVSANLFSTQQHYSLLQFACQLRDLETVNMLLTLGASQTEERISFVPEIHITIKNGDTDILKSLLAHGMDVNQKSSYTGDTPIIYAIENAQFHIAKILVLAGADLSITRGPTELSNFKEYSPLMFVAAKKFDEPREALDFIDWLFNLYQGNKQRLEDILNISCIQSKSGFQKQRVSALNLAIISNNIPLIEKFIQAGASLGKHLELGGLIQTLGNYGSLDVLRYFLEKEHINITEKDINDQSLIDVAIAADRAGVVTFLFKKYQVATQKTFSELLVDVWFKAVRASAINLMAILKKKKPFLLEAVDEQGKTAFMHSMSYKCFNDMVETVYEYSPHFARKDHQGYTALVCAAQSDHEHQRELIYFLLDNLQKNTTPEDFQEQWLIALSVLDANKKVSSRILLATYFEKRLLEKLLPELVSKAGISYEELLQSFQGREAEVLTICTYQLLRFDNTDLRLSPELESVTQKLMLDITRMIVARIDNNDAFTEIQHQLLAASLKIILGLGRSRFNIQVFANIAMGYQTNMELVLKNVPNTLYIINLALYISAKKFGELERELKCGYLELCGSVVKNLSYLRDFPPQALNAFRELMRTFLSKIKPNSTYSSQNQEWELLLHLQYKLNLITVAINEGHSADLIYFLLNHVCLINDSRSYEQISQNAKVAAQAKNKKEIELLLTLCAYQFDIENHINMINADNLEQVVAIVDSKLKETFKESTPCRSIIPVLSLFKSFWAGPQRDALMLLMQRAFKQLLQDLALGSAEYITGEDQALICVAANVVILNKYNHFDDMEKYGSEEGLVDQALSLRTALCQKNTETLPTQSVIIFGREQGSSVAEDEQLVACKTFYRSK